VADTNFWHYVFSPRAMLIDGISGLISVALFWMVRGERPRTLKAWFVLALVSSVVSHILPGVPRARSMPIGYVGNMVGLCMQQASQESCLCAVDTLKERIGDIPLVQMGVRAQANVELPKEFLDALAECSAG